MKSVQGQSVVVKTEYVLVHRSILEHYKIATVCADVMFVRRVTILVTVPQNIHYETVHGLLSMKIPMMEVAIQGVVKSYTVKGFLVKLSLLISSLRQSRIVIILKEQLLILSPGMNMSKTLSNLFEF